MAVKTGRRMETSLRNMGTFGAGGGEDYFTETRAPSTSDGMG